MSGATVLPEEVTEVTQDDATAEADSPAAGSRPREIAIGVGVAVLGAAVLLAVQALLPEAGRDAFGPRWWPGGLALALTALGVALAIVGGLRPAAATEDAPTRRGIVRLVILLALIVAYGAAWQFIHFIPVTLVLSCAAAVVLGARGWKGLIVFPIVITAILFLLFGVLLGVPL
ncbi:tripartite tricarboxylate transporter TctB family protein [Microbacterium sp. Marseille-Q6965]|uniref:tripartite tricarboxylate transporter TctB family protein n=1 Tax=Microbacterium sp. Marseille-Q6965 TaxID=2965072 RepID=UPI0021B7E2EF|nr:tripartite tricarboxylate transporter TctB family protein [Microbacterium sp. Marseille-Q6965]